MMINEKCVYDLVCDDPIPTNISVLMADGHFMVARALYYRYHQLWVPAWVQGLFGRYRSYISKMAKEECVYGQFGVPLFPLIAASLGRVVILF